MKLTAVQIRQIEQHLQGDKLFYDDIRLELIDHIASHFEATLTEKDNFDTALKQYMNSHHKVKLLTAARAQEKVRDGYYRRYFLKQFITPKGALLTLAVVAMLYIGNSFTPWVEYACIFFFGFLVIWFMLGLRGLESPFLRRLTGELQFYYLVPILVVSQSRRFLEPTDILIYTELFFYALMITSMYFVHLTYKNYKTTRYA